MSWRLAFSGLVGLLLGFAGQRAFRDSLAEMRDDRNAGETVPWRPGRPEARAAVLRSGPTTLLLRELSNAPAERCEEMVRAHLDAGRAGDNIALEAIFRRWMTFESPERILEKLADTGTDRWRAETNAAFFYAWAATDEADAMDAARHPDRFASARALFAIESGNPSFAGFLGTENLETRIDAALAALGRDRPEIAASIALAKQSVATKSKAIEAVARGWAGNDPQAALEWLQSLSGVDIEKAAAAVLFEWVKRDLPGALAAAEASGLKPGREAAGLFSNPRGALAHLRFAVASDPFMDAAALHRHLSERDIDWEKAVFQNFGAEHDGWYCADPTAAAREIERLPPGKVRDFLLGSFSHSWLMEDREAALDFADRHGISSSWLDHVRSEPDEKLRRAAREAPEETFAALFDMPEPIHSQLYQLAQEWAERDPEKAADWVITQSLEEDSRSIDMRRLLFDNTLGHHWVQQDALGAARWLEELPDEDAALRSRAWATMQEYAERYSPDLAFGMSAAYLEGDSRVRLLESHLEKVRLSIGHGAALELLKNPNLSAEESAALAGALRAADSRR